MNPLLIGLILFAFPSIFAAGDENDNADFLLIEANKFFEQGEFENAVSYYNQILEVQPENLDALYGIGASLLNQEKQNESLVYFEQILEIEPYYKDSIGTFNFDVILQINPNHIDALNSKGSSLVALDRSEEGITIVVIEHLDEALSYFDKVLEIDPNNVDALNNKGTIFLQKEEYDLALEYFEKGLKIEPNNIDGLFKKADVFYKTSKLDDSMKILDKLLELEPNHPDALYKKGIIIYREDRPNEALAIFNQIIENNPEHSLATDRFSDVVVDLGLRYTDANGYQETIIRDENGGLVGHLKTSKLKHLAHTITYDWIDSWPVEKVITLNGSDVEVLKYETTWLETKRTILGGIGGERYAEDDRVEQGIFKIFSLYQQFPVESGDTVSFVYRIYRLAE